VAAGELVDAGALRQRFSFEHRTDENGAEFLVVEVWVDEGGGVTPHVHPAMEERFDILEGTPEFLAGRKWKEYGPGDTVVVPPGTRHAYRNRTAQQAHFRAEARPPSTLQAFLEDTAGMARAGLISRRAIPKGLRGMLAGAVLAHHYRDMVELGFPLPPQPVQRLLLAPIARLGERRGYRPGRLADL
jgi:quercetin dioxygenase-like cupin family protein